MNVEKNTISEQKTFGSIHPFSKLLVLEAGVYNSLILL